MHSDMSQPAGPWDEKIKSYIQYPDDFLRSEGLSIFGNAFYHQVGEGQFEEISDLIGAENYWPWGLSSGDLNADGWQDVFVASSMNYPFRYGINTVLLNDEGRGFLDSEFVLGVEPRRDGRTAQPWFALDCDDADIKHKLCEGQEGGLLVYGALGTRSSALFDVEGDGDLDIVTNEFNGVPQVLLSDLSQRRAVRYVEVVLVGNRRIGMGWARWSRWKLAIRSIPKCRMGSRGICRRVLVDSTLAWEKRRQWIASRCAGPRVRYRPWTAPSRRTSDLP